MRLMLRVVMMHFTHMSEEMVIIRSSVGLLIRCISRTRAKRWPAFRSNLGLLAIHLAHMRKEMGLYASAYIVKTSDTLSKPQIHLARTCEETDGLYIFDATRADMRGDSRNHIRLAEKPYRVNHVSLLVYRIIKRNKIGLNLLVVRQNVLPPENFFHVAPYAKRNHIKFLKVERNAYKAVRPASIMRLKDLLLMIRQNGFFKPVLVCRLCVEDDAASVGRNGAFEVRIGFHRH